MRLALACIHGANAAQRSRDDGRTEKGDVLDETHSPEAVRDDEIQLTATVPFRGDHRFSAEIECQVLGDDWESARTKRLHDRSNSSASNVPSSTAIALLRPMSTATAAP